MLVRGLRRCGWPHHKLHEPVRTFTAFPWLLEKPLPPRRAIIESEITESFLKGTGPGGQKINKTSSAVQLKHLPSGIVVKCQETRSREQNRKLARRILSEKLEEIEKGDESRTAIKIERAREKKARAVKKTRRKYKKLEEEKTAPEDVSSDGGGNMDSESTPVLDEDVTKHHDTQNVERQEGKT